MFHFLRHFFTPHHTNNHRAKLLHHDTVLIVSFFIFLATFVFSSIKNTYPDVLGAAVHISVQELLQLTNKVRQENGLQPLIYNQQLVSAAEMKAQNMFAYNYWAHISPSGVTPWVFIQNSGYQYIYAGENLARGFSNANDAVNAWMASPSHRANVLSQHYQDVGFAIEEGTLTGEKNTVLIVEEFGGKTSEMQAAKPKVSEQLPATTVLAEAASGQQNTTLAKQPVIDRFSFAKSVTQILLFLFIVIFILDLILVERKRITRIVWHNLDHILFLTGIFLFIVFLSSGAIY